MSGDLETRLRDWIKRHRYPAEFPDYDGGYQSALDDIEDQLLSPAPGGPPLRGERQADDEGTADSATQHGDTPGDEAANTAPRSLQGRNAGMASAATPPTIVAPDGL